MTAYDIQFFLSHFWHLPNSIAKQLENVKNGFYVKLMKVIIILLVKKNEAERVYLELQMSFYYKSSKSSFITKT